MTKQQEYLEKMYDAVLETLDHYESEWTGVTEINSSVTEFKQLVSRFKELTGLQELDIKGYTDASERHLESALSQFFILRNALIAYAKKYQKDVLFEEVNYSDTDIKKASMKTAENRLGVLLEKGQEYSNALVGFDLNTGFLNNCAQLLETYSNYNGAYRNARLKKTQITLGIEEQVKTIQEFLRDILDPSIGVLLNTPFYKTYKKSRKLLKRGGKKKTTQIEPQSTSNMNNDGAVSETPAPDTTTNDSSNTTTTDE